MRGDQRGECAPVSSWEWFSSLSCAVAEDEVVCIEVCPFLKYCLLLDYRQTSYATIEYRLHSFPLFRRITYAYLCSNVSLQNAILPGRTTLPLTTACQYRLGYRTERRGRTDYGVPASLGERPGVYG